MQVKYSMSFKHSMEDKHATGISFSMLKDHMALQNAKVPYSCAMVLEEKDVHRWWLSQCQNLKTCSSEAFHLLAAPHAPGNLTLSCTGFSAWLQNIEQETLAHPVSSGHTAGCNSATAHTQPAQGFPEAPTPQAVQEQQV